MAESLQNQRMSAAANSGGRDHRTERNPADDLAIIRPRRLSAPGRAGQVRCHVRATLSVIGHRDAGLFLRWIGRRAGRSRRAGRFVEDVVFADLADVLDCLLPDDRSRVILDVVEPHGGIEAVLGLICMMPVAPEELWQAWSSSDS